MGIFKISRAEARKVFAKPGIFILTFILILILAGSALIYTPTERVDLSVNMSANTVGEIFTEFDLGITVNSKTSIDSLYVDASNLFVDFFETANTSLTTLQADYDDIVYYAGEYQQAVYNLAGNETLDNRQNELKISILTFKSDYTSILDTSDYNLLITAEEHTQFLQFLNTVLSKFPTEEFTPDHTTVLSNISSLNFQSTLQNYLTGLEIFEVDTEIVDAVNYFYQNTVLIRLTTIYNEIVAFNDTNSTSEEDADKAAINALITDYKFLAMYYNDVALTTIISNGFEDYSNVQVNEFRNFETLDLYYLQEVQTKAYYLVNSNTYDYEYSQPFSMDSTSNNAVNAFDFAFFTLELFSFIIIIYTIVVGAGMIAGEEANGTMKLLAIRPYKRSKILMGKLVATLRIAFQLLIISSVVSLITGYYLFGIESLPIMHIFNSEYIVVMNAYLSFALYLFTLFIEMIFYIFIAVSISTIFKSHVGAVAISILVYFGAIALNLVSGSWLKFVPLANIDLYKYFGNAYITSSASLTSLLSAKPIIDSSFFFSLAYITVVAVILLVTALITFNKREIK